MQTVNNCFSKQLRLTAQKDITTLFLHGKAFFVFPYRVVYSILPCNAGQKAVAKMAPTVSKKKFKHAVKRNYIKRISKEAWRTQHQVLQEVCTQHNCILHCMLNYTHTETDKFEHAKKAVAKILVQLADAVKTNILETKINSNHK